MNFDNFREAYASKIATMITFSDDMHGKVTNLVHYVMDLEATLLIFDDLDEDQREEILDDIKNKYRKLGVSVEVKGNAQ